MGHRAAPSFRAALAERLTGISGPSFAVNRLGAVAITAFSAWMVLMFGSTEVGHLSFVGLWVIAVGCFLGGFAVAGPMRGQPQLRTVVLAVALFGLAVGLVVIARAYLGASWLQVGALGGLAVGFGGAGILARLWWPQALSSSLVLAIGVGAFWVLLDVLRLSDGIGLYDFQVYLGSATRFVAGENPYLSTPLTEQGPDPASAGFLSPPILLPFFALLAGLPYPVAATLWVILLLACAVGGLRLLGMPWRWAVLLLAYPPLLPESGNVANVIFALFCLGPLVGGALPAGSLFKVQAGIPTLWLVRERRWRDLAYGLLLLAGLALVTFPLVGMDTWVAYFVGLQMRTESQEALPILYGLSLAQWMPWGIFIGLSVAVIMVALLVPGLRGLSGLGLATIVASPTLWAHGFAVAIPAVLLLQAPLFWLSLGVGSFGQWFWVLPIVGAWAIWSERAPSVPRDAMHPLRGRGGPWEAPGRRRLRGG
jgi:hypothetical protein